MISHKTSRQVFHSNEHIKCVGKAILLKNYFHLKDDKKSVEGLCIKICFICLSKFYMKSKKIVTKIY